MPIRVHMLAKELDVTSKDIIAEAMNHGVEVANHMSSLTEAQANLIRAFLQVAPPTEEDKKRAEREEAEREAQAVEEAKKKIAAAKARKAQIEAERETEDESPAMASLDDSPPTVHDGGEMRPLSPPDLLGIVARRREEEAARARADEEPAEAAGATAPTLNVSTDEIAARTVNRAPITPPRPEAEAEAEVDEAPQPKEMRISSPGEMRTVQTRGVNPVSDKEPTREMPQRRQAKILGHKEIRPPQPTRRPPMDRGRPGPGAGGPSAPLDPGGMIQTKSQGSKRTFVRAPQRGGGPGGGRRFGHGGPGGGGGRGGQNRVQPQRRNKTTEVKPQDCTVEMPINIKNLSAAMAVKSGMIIERLLKNHGMFLNINSILDKDTLEIVALEFDCDITIK